MRMNKRTWEFQIQTGNDLLSLGMNYSMLLINEILGYANNIDYLKAENSVKLEKTSVGKYLKQLNFLHSILFFKVESNHERFSA